MAEEHFITTDDQETMIKVEALAAIYRAKEILDGLAAITVLQLKGAGGSDMTLYAWRELYKDSPWVGNDEDLNDGLPRSLAEALDVMIIKQVATVWKELAEVERLFGPEIYDLLADQAAPAGG
jgi:hypothetical protein